MKTAETIEAATSDKAEKLAKKPRHPNSLKNLKMWKPGESGNPGGRMKGDMSAQISRAIFENNPEMIYKAYAKALAKGQAFAFQVIAERGYGKLVQKQEVGDPGAFESIDESGINKRISDILRDLGLTSAIDDAGRVTSAHQGERPTNGKAEDTELLPR